VRRIAVCLGLVGLVATGITGIGAGPAHVLAGCKYKGGDNALPATGTPYGVYGNGSMAPSGHIGFSNGSKSGYLQASGDADGVQVEGNSDTAGQSGYANTSGQVSTSC
jgi:hypothetical protein